MTKNIPTTLFDKLTHLICIDLIYSKGLNVDNVVHKHSLQIHNIVFGLCALIAVVFFTDVFVFNGFLSKSIINNSYINNGYLRFFEGEIIKLYFLLCSITVFVAAFPLSGYFYWTHGHKVNRNDFISSRVINTSISNFFMLVGSVIGIGITFVGGWVLAVVLPEYFALNEDPLLLAVQIFIVIKSHAFMAMSLSWAILIMLPYSLHSKRR